MAWNYPLAEPALLQRIQACIQSIGVAHLITQGPEGYARSRGMADLNVGSDFVFYFATPASSRKIAELQADQAMTIAYLDPKSQDYVCVFGQGEVVMDDAVRGAQWRDGWERYWPCGKTDPDYAIVRMAAEAVEFFSMADERTYLLAIPRPLGA